MGTPKGFPCHLRPSDQDRLIPSDFDKGKQVLTIQNYRSAIAVVHEGCHDGWTVGANKVINHPLSGMLNTCLVIKLFAGVIWVSLVGCVTPPLNLSM